MFFKKNRVLKFFTTCLESTKKIFAKLIPVVSFKNTSKNIRREGMGVDLIKYIVDAANTMPSMHDMKIHLQSDLHKYLVAQGYPTHAKNKSIKLEMKTDSQTTHAKNKSIKLEMKTDSQNITVKALVYPRTVHIDIGCTNEPFPLLPAGGIKLTSLLNKIKQFLCEQSSHKAEISEIGQWEMTRHDRGQDGEITYDGKKFHITIENVIGGFAQIYSKEKLDGSLMTRIEQVRTEKIKINDLLNKMRGESFDNV